MALPARAATPATICAFGSPATDVNNGTLQAMVARGEADVAQGAGAATPGAILAWLATPLAGSESATEAMRARFCAAAGEALRTAPDGNQTQAKAYLYAAARFATATGDARLAASATYRLALAALSGDAAAGAGTRGAHTATTPPDEPTSDGPCASVDQPKFLRLSGKFAARSALECALIRARAANDPALAALAALRLTRFGIAQATATPGRGRQLRAAVVPVALGGLVDARGIVDAASRDALSLRLAEAALDAGSTDATAINAAIGPAINLSGGDPGRRAFAAALQGRLALARDDRRAAAAALQRAVFYEGQRVQPVMMPTWLLLLAEAEPERRAGLTLQAYRALEAVRPLTPALDPLTEESVFSLRMKPVFEAAVAVELADTGSAQEQARIASAQRIVEAYRQAELQNAFGANCVPSRDPVDPAKLRTGEVLLYPILLDDRVELLVVSGGNRGSTYVRVPSGAQSSREAVGRLVDDMVASASRGTDDEWRASGRALYDLLIKPVEGRLGTNGTLIVIPDGALRALPFAALTDSDGKFLIERTRLAVAPALAFSQPGSDRTSRTLSVVAASLQREVTLPSGVFAKLEGTADEAGVAAGPGGRVIADFREADLRAALSRGRVDVLHLATHAAFNGRSDRSFIVANGESIPLADLRGLIGANRTRGDELDLLVLSACETAVGDDEASMGLAGAAVQSGAESALASLWSVNDTGTVALMKGFYGQYREGAGKAEALRNAQLALIAGGGTNAQPGIWAAFILLGGWR